MAEIPVPPVLLFEFSHFSRRLLRVLAKLMKGRAEGHMLKHSNTLFCNSW